MCLLVDLLKTIYRLSKNLKGCTATGNNSYIKNVYYFSFFISYMQVFNGNDPAISFPERFIVRLRKKKDIMAASQVRVEINKYVILLINHHCDGV